MKTLPCPFCGGSEQEIYDLYYDGSHRLIYCKCGAQAGEAEDELGAIALWNRRSVLKESSFYYQCLSCQANFRGRSFFPETSRPFVTVLSKKNINKEKPFGYGVHAAHREAMRQTEKEQLPLGTTAAKIKH